MHWLKNYFTLLVPAFFILLLVLPFQSCEPEEETDICSTCPPCDTCIIAHKPNIYIYPEETLDLFVGIEFPRGGAVIASIPAYGSGWNVTVEPGGLINGTYRFLFYESMQPDVWQYEKGWVISKDQLSTFFRQNLENHGFDGYEIVDFIEYWIPRLTAMDFYAIYPQTASLIEEVINLEFSIEPDHLLRLFYVVEGLPSPPALLPAEPEPVAEFTREGYFATEWGVILK